MNPLVHIISALAVFGLLFKTGAPLDFVVIAILSSVLIDMDHFLFGRMAGSYHPRKIYEFCMSGKIFEFIPPERLISCRIFDVKVLPLHNIVLAVFALVLYLPVGLGMLLHIMTDVFSDSIGMYFYNRR
jgi:hypothetical protein